MNLTITNNVLTACTLKEKEHTLVLPALDRIADDAFAGIPKGQLHNLDVTCVGSFAPHAFRGLGKLKTLTVRAYDYEERDNYLLESPLMADTLCIREADLPDGSKGVFSLSAMVAEGYPRRLITTSEIDLRYTAHEVTEIDEKGFAPMQELTLYVKGEFSWDGTFTNPIMHGVRDLRMINSRYCEAEDPTLIHELIPTCKPKTIPENWLPMPCSFADRGFLYPTEAYMLRKLALPEGLTCIPDWAFRNVGTMTKLELPASVERIGRLAFSHCHELREVSMSPAAFENMGPNAFVGCFKLRDLHVYGEEGCTGKDLCEKMQMCIAVNHAIRLAEQVFPEALAETRRENPGCDDEVVIGRLCHKLRGEPAADIIECLLGRF